jgi:hypothetical protein
MAASVTVLVVTAGCGGGDGDEKASVSASSTATDTTSSSEGDALTYTTNEFLDGEMRLAFEDGWSVTEDSPGHLAAAEDEDPEYRVMFSLDPYPMKRGRRVRGVSATADSLFGWLSANPDIRVSPKPEASIGGDLPATVADVSISGKAVSDDPTCPDDVCVNFLAFPPSGEGYGLAGDDVIRLYLADIHYNGRKHVLAVTMEGRDRRDLNAFVGPAKRVVATAELPATAG